MPGRVLNWLQPYLEPIEGLLQFPKFLGMSAQPLHMQEPNGDESSSHLFEAISIFQGP
jgi:hypothetical protein